jgi:hypothetical protein
MIIRLLGLITFAISVVPAAQAEEENKNPYMLLPKDVYFQPGGGIRVRYENLRGATGGGFPEAEDEAEASHRAQFDFRLYKGEYFETFFRFINHADWGSAAGDTNGGQRDGFARSNGILVNQAYGIWKLDSDVDYLRFGRAPLNLGLGYTYGTNDWFNVPYSFDMMDVGWDWGSVELAIMAAKVQELTRRPGDSVSSDPEENHIIINLDVKNPWDALEFINLNVVQVNRDIGSNDGGLTATNGLNAQRISLESKITGKNFFGSAFLAFVTGEETVAASNLVGGADKLDVSQTALDLKLGYTFSQANNLKFWAGYHADSGDSDPGDGNSKSYDSFFYEVYGQSGLMDLIRWGNLTFLTLAMQVDIYTGLSIGASWWSFEKSEANDGVQFGYAGRFFQDNIAGGNLALGTNTDLGNEFDLWIERQYPSGLNIRLTFASFFPGQTFSTATGNGGGSLASGNTPNSDIYQYLAQVGYFF